MRLVRAGTVWMRGAYEVVQETRAASGAAVDSGERFLVLTFCGFTEESSEARACIRRVRQRDEGSGITSD